MANPPLTSSPTVDQLRQARSLDLIKFVHTYKASAKTEAARLVLENRISNRLLFATWVLVVVTVVLAIATIALISTG